jgi:hypothetical protein
MSGEAYTKRFPAGFVDKPSQTTRIDSQYLNGTEAALARLLGADPTDKGVQIWDAVLGRMKTALVKNENIDPNALITRSKLDFGPGLNDGDLAPGANIAQSKISGLQSSLDAKIDETLFDAKGDLVVASANDTQGRLPVSGTLGDVLTADPAQPLALKWAALPSTALPGAWTAYVPAWTASGTAPVLGNGTIVGAYVQLGKLVSFRAQITMGSTTTYGTGTWSLSLPPVALKANWVGTLVMIDASAGSMYAGFSRNSPGLLLNFAAPATVVSNTAPFPWAVSDTLEMYGTYEAA